MATATRNAKAPVTVEDLETGVAADRARAGAQPRADRGAPPPAPRPSFEPAGPDEVLEGLTEFDATFPARGARAVALERSAGAPIQAALDQLRQLRSSEDILVLADGTGTTRKHRGWERTVVQITERLTATRIEPLPPPTAAREVGRLDRELAKMGGRLSDEQRAAIELACGEHPLVVIEGQAGTGKSTTLTGIARAHQACGREIVVTSTAALAAERLATELTDRGVTCQAFSTAAPARRDHQRARGAHIGDDGDPRRGRARLHPRANQTAPRDRGIRRPADRRRRPTPEPARRRRRPLDQDRAHHPRRRRTRRAHPQPARPRPRRPPRPSQIPGGEGRAGDPRLRRPRPRPPRHRSSNAPRIQALDAAHADRTSGKATIVIAQTSNEHLDELNARAQAIRHQHGQLGHEHVRVPGRPYDLHAGDHVQVRHTIHHEHGSCATAPAP